jgi:hypothetical protein
MGAHGICRRRSVVGRRAAHDDWPVDRIGHRQHDRDRERRPHVLTKSQTCGLRPVAASPGLKEAALSLRHEAFETELHRLWRTRPHPRPRALICGEPANPSAMLKSRSEKSAPASASSPGSRASASRFGADASCLTPCSQSDPARTSAGSSGRMKRGGALARPGAAFHD